MRFNPLVTVVVPGNRNGSRRHSISARHSVSPRAQFQPIFEQFERYLQQHALSLATIRNYLADLRAFGRWHFAYRRPSTDLPPADFRAYRDYLLNETEHSTSTVNRRLQALRLFGRFLCEMGRAAENPARDLALLRNGNGHLPAPRTLTRPEVAALGRAIRAGRPSQVRRDYAIMQLMLQAGLRVHEIAGVCLRDLVPTGRGMSIRIAGNGRSGERLVPLNSVAAKALREYLPTRPAVPWVDHLFLSQRGLPLSMRSIQRLVDSHARSVGLIGVCAQSLRHTCAKNMLLETRDVALVARWLGCRDAKSLERYTG